MTSSRSIPLALLLLACFSQALAQQCRMDPDSRHDGCALPQELGNFQVSYYECDKSVKIGRPNSLKEAQSLVTMFDRVRAVGVGHSWNKEFFCAGNNNRSIDIVMTELKPVVDFIMRPTDPKEWLNRQIPFDFPIKVDEENGLVTVAAGIPQRMLLEYLAQYKYWKQSEGWVLPAFSWFLDQTIGGAIATGTHGSSLRWGSLSSQVRGFKLILANGTLLELKNPNDDIHLWRAVGVSVGRLGVVAELTLRIKPQQSVRRNLNDMDFPEFAKEIKSVQDEYVAATKAGDVDAQKRALFRLHETQALWHVGTQAVWRTDYEHLEKEPLSVLLNIDHADPTVQAMSGPMQGAFDQKDKAAVNPNPAMTLNARYWGNFFSTSTRGFVTPGTFESSRAYISMSEFGTRMSSTFAPYDQYEVAIPIERAGDCMMEVGAEIYGPGNLWEGFRSPALVRFVSGEDFYLSPSNGGPVMYVNMEDYISKSTKKPNEKFDKVIDLFMTRCGARMHWGKAGWPQHNKCFDGAVQYPNSWCDFGCAVQQLDPAGKFKSESNVWQWAATKDGASVEFGSCCSAKGFNRQCTCAPINPCAKENVVASSGSP